MACVHFLLRLLLRPCWELRLVLCSVNRFLGMTGGCCSTQWNSWRLGYEARSSVVLSAYVCCGLGVAFGVWQPFPCSPCLAQQKQRLEFDAFPPPFLYRDHLPSLDRRQSTMSGTLGSPRQLVPLGSGGPRAWERGKLV